MIIIFFINFVENEKTEGVFNLNDYLILSWVICLNDFAVLYINI